MDFFNASPDGAPKAVLESLSHLIEPVVGSFPVKSIDTLFLIVPTDITPEISAPV